MQFSIFEQSTITIIKDVSFQISFKMFVVNRFVTLRTESLKPLHLSRFRKANRVSLNPLIICSYEYLIPGFKRNNKSDFIIFNAITITVLNTIGFIYINYEHYSVIFIGFKSVQSKEHNLLSSQELSGTFFFVVRNGHEGKLGRNAPYLKPVSQCLSQPERYHQSVRSTQAY